MELGECDDVVRIINAAVQEEKAEVKQEQRRAETMPLAVSPEFQPLYELCRREDTMKLKTRIVRRNRRNWRFR